MKRLTADYDTFSHTGGNKKSSIYTLRSHASMQYRTLGQTGWNFSWLSFGRFVARSKSFATSNVNEALRSVRVALDGGMNFIDTSPFYGRGMSELPARRRPARGAARLILSRHKARPATRRRILISRPSASRRASRSVCSGWASSTWSLSLSRSTNLSRCSRSLTRHCRRCACSKPRARSGAIGISGYPMKMFRFVLDQTDLDVILSYNHYTLQNTMLAGLGAVLQAKNVGILNAAPFSARLLTNATLHKMAQSDTACRETAAQAAKTVAPSVTATSPNSRCSFRCSTRR